MAWLGILCSNETDNKKTLGLERSQGPAMRVCKYSMMSVAGLWFRAKISFIACIFCIKVDSSGALLIFVSRFIAEDILIAKAGNLGWGELVCVHASSQRNLYSPFMLSEYNPSFVVSLLHSIKSSLTPRVKSVLKSHWQDEFEGPLTRWVWDTRC